MVSIEAGQEVQAGPSSKPLVSPAGESAPSTVKRRRWAPTRHLTEAPHPPVVDHRQEEEAAAHQAAQEAGYEGRRVRKFLQRRTVDYNESFIRWKLHRNTITCVRDDRTIWPGVNHVVELLPSAAYRSSAQAVTTNLVHSSTNKIRCPVNVLKWTPEGRRLLTGSTSGEFTLWNGLTFNFETILQAHDHAIRAIEYTKSGAWILSADQGGVIKYFQSNMNNLQMINAHREAVRDLSFSPDDSRFVSASDDSTMKIWSFEEAREESTVKGHGWDVKAVDWHPFKGLLVSGSKDNLVKFWDPRTCTTLATYHGHKGTVQAVQWSKDGNLVATASRDQVIKLYDIRAMGELHTLKGHPNDVCSVDWHPTHRDMLASGGSEGSILFWSLNASDPGAAVHSMPTAHDSNIWALRWHPLGHVLASGSNDHTTRFWERARPEDGRLAHEGQDADAQQASKLQRWNKAVRGGGEDWDDDAGFIPGLGAGAKRANGSSTQAAPAPSAAAPRAPEPDQFLPPGLGRNSAGPGGAMPNMPNYPNGNHGAGMNGGDGRSSGFVPAPREEIQSASLPGLGRGSYPPPPREAGGFVPPPRDEAGGFVPPPRESAGQYAGSAGGRFVPPPRDDNAGSGGGGGYRGNGAGYIPPPREEQYGGGGFGGGGPGGTMGFQQQRPPPFQQGFRGQAPPPGPRGPWNGQQYPPPQNSYGYQR